MNRVLSRSIHAGIGMALIVSLAAPWSAGADNLVADAILATSTSENTINFGSVCAGTATVLTQTAGIFFKKSNGTSAGANGSTQAITATPDDAALSATGGSITLPSNWSTLATGSLSQKLASTVTLNVLSTTPAGAVGGTVKYDAPAFNGPQNISVHGTVVVCDTTGPSLSVSFGTATGDNGWYTSAPVSGSATATDASNVASLSCTGAAEGTKSGIGTTSAIDSLTVSGEGGHSVACQAADGLGNPSSAGALVNIDTVSPTITGSRLPTANSYGWNNGPVTVTFVCSDDTSGIPIGFCPTATTLSGEGAGQSLTGNVSDTAGLMSSATVGDINIDLTKPNISGTAVPAANVNGWNNTAVTVTFTCDDLGGTAHSGVASCLGNATLGEGANQHADGAAVDKAGNSASATVGSGINVDLTKPSVSVTGVSATNYTVGNVPAAGCSVADTLSGPVNASPAPTGAGTAVGSYTVTCSGEDKAGNTNSAQVTYNVSYAICGYTMGLPKKSGSTLPVKLEICDASGKNLSSAGITVTSLSIAPQLIGMSPDGTVEDSGSANPDSNFRFDQTLFGGSGGYIFNLQLKDKSTGLNLASGSYQLKFKAGADPISHHVDFAVGK